MKELFNVCSNPPLFQFVLLTYFNLVPGSLIFPPPEAREKREFSLAPGGGNVRDPGSEVVLTYATAQLGIVRETRVSSTNTNRK